MDQFYVFAATTILLDPLTLAVVCALSAFCHLVMFCMTVMRRTPISLAVIFINDTLTDSSAAEGKCWFVNCLPAVSHLCKHYVLTNSSVLFVNSLTLRIMILYDEWFNLSLISDSNPKQTCQSALTVVPWPYSTLLASSDAVSSRQFVQGRGRDQGSKLEAEARQKVLNMIMGKFRNLLAVS